MEDKTGKASNILAARYHHVWEALSREQVEKIHEASLQILEHTGIAMPHGRVQEALAAAGAKVDQKKNKVFFPAAVLMDLLKKAPAGYTLYARNPARDLLLDGRHGYLTLDGCGLQVLDLEGGNVRPSTRQDLAAAVRVADALEQVAFLWPVISAQDSPRREQPLYELATLFANSSKHIQAMTAVSGRMARGSVEMAAAVAGGSRALKERPIISNFVCSISPLSYDRESLEAALVFAAAGIPMGFMTMQIGCSTAPATLAGNLALGNAEIVAGMAALQAVYPGAATFYGSCATVMELRSGGVTCGGPEDFMLQAMSTQMAHYYNVPANIGTFATGAKAPNWHAGVEGSISGSISILAGADMMCGAGLLYGARIFSFEQLLMDCEIFEIIRRTTGGLEINAETLALETIGRVGSEDHYMVEPHTIAHLREMWQPSVINRDSYEKWRDNEKKDALETAREKAKQILLTHEPEPLEDGLELEIEKIINSYQKEGGN